MYSIIKTGLIFFCMLFVVPTVYFASAAYEVLENETLVNIHCDIKGASLTSSSVRVSALQFTVPSSALSKLSRL